MRRRAPRAGCCSARAALDSRTEDLPADYRRIMEIVAGGAGPLQAKDMARELGLDPGPARVEPVRGKLRKLAERGWITRTPAGRYIRDR